MVLYIGNDKKEKRKRLDMLLKKKSELEQALETCEINAEKKIVEAINNQSFFFFRNKPNIVFDRKHGLLWPNMNTYECVWDTRESIAETFFGYNPLVLDGITGWRYPTANELYNFAKEKDNPFHSGEGNSLMGISSFMLKSNKGEIIWLNDEELYIGQNGYKMHFLPCSSILTDNTKYEILTVDNEEISSKHYMKVYTTNEDIILHPELKGKLILNLFVENNLYPIFNNKEITVLYESYKKNELVNDIKKELEILENDISECQKEPDYILNFKEIINKYDLDDISSSMLKYCEAVKNFSSEMFKVLENYENNNRVLVEQYNLIVIKLSDKYTYNKFMNEKENELFLSLQKIVQKEFSISILSSKNKILKLKQQVDEYEKEIDEIYESDDLLFGLTKVEQRKPVAFPLLVEHTVQIINSSIKNMEFFRNNRDFFDFIINSWESWQKDYIFFKTSELEKLKIICTEDQVEENIYLSWCTEWSELRYKVGKKLEPLLEHYFSKISDYDSNNLVMTLKKLILSINIYKAGIDSFFLEERKGIYQRFAFQVGTELQEKIETEINMYKCANTLQNNLQEVIFNYAEIEDRIFILNWASDLLNIQIDDLLQYISDQRLDNISNKVLDEFSQLRLQNLDNYLSDAKAYAQEKNRREKEFNSLMFKMRKAVTK